MLKRIVDGDHGAFEVLVRRHTDKFFGLAYRTVADRDLAADIVQKSFIKLWQYPARFDPSSGASFTTWFYRVVLNEARDALRRQKRLGVHVSVDGLSLAFEQPEETALQQEKEEKFETLEREIQSLPDRQKDALNLCFYEGLSNKEAASVLGVGVKALESLLMRGKARLKTKLQDGARGAS